MLVAGRIGDDWKAADAKKRRRGRSGYDGDPIASIHSRYQAASSYLISQQTQQYVCPFLFLSVRVFAPIDGGENAWVVSPSICLFHPRVRPLPPLTYRSGPFGLGSYITLRSPFSLYLTPLPCFRSPLHRCTTTDDLLDIQTMANIRSRVEWFANLNTSSAPVPTEETKFHRKVCGTRCCCWICVRRVY